MLPTCWETLLKKKTHTSGPNTHVWRLGGCTLTLLHAVVIQVSLHTFDTNRIDQRLCVRARANNVRRRKLKKLLAVTAGNADRQPLERLICLNTIVAIGSGARVHRVNWEVNKLDHVWNASTPHTLFRAAFAWTRACIVDGDYWLDWLINLACTGIAGSRDEWIGCHPRVNVSMWADQLQSVICDYIYLMDAIRLWSDWIFKVERRDDDRVDKTESLSGGVTAARALHFERKIIWWNLCMDHSVLVCLVVM